MEHHVAALTPGQSRITLSINDDSSAGQMASASRSSRRHKMLIYAVSGVALIAAAAIGFAVGYSGSGGSGSSASVSTESLSWQAGNADEHKFLHAYGQHIRGKVATLQNTIQEKQAATNGAHTAGLLDDVEDVADYVAKRQDVMNYLNTTSISKTLDTLNQLVQDGEKDTLDAVAHIITSDISSVVSDGGFHVTDTGDSMGVISSFAASIGNAVTSSTAAATAYVQSEEAYLNSWNGLRVSCLAGLTALAYNTTTATDTQGLRYALSLGGVELHSVYVTTSGYHAYTAIRRPTSEGELPVYFLVLRGTDSLSDGVTDADAIQVPGPIPGNVHEGFLGFWNEVQSYFLGVISEYDSQYGFHLSDAYGPPIYVMGHSLGAGTATIGAPALTTVGVARERVRLYAFAPPRAGDGTFAEAVQDYVYEKWSIIYYKDPVPHSPPSSHNWVHAPMVSVFRMDAPIDVGSGYHNTEGSASSSWWGDITSAFDDAWYDEYHNKYIYATVPLYTPGGPYYDGSQASSPPPSSPVLPSTLVYDSQKFCMDISFDYTPFDASVFGPSQN